MGQGKQNRERSEATGSAWTATNKRNRGARPLSVFNVDPVAPLRSRFCFAVAAIARFCIGCPLWIKVTLCKAQAPTCHL